MIWRCNRGRPLRLAECWVWVRVVVRTSVDGYSHIWKSVLDRFFTRYDGAAQIEINDFGATPGVVALRLAEAVEAAEEGDAV